MKWNHLSCCGYSVTQDIYWMLTIREWEKRSVWINSTTQHLLKHIVMLYLICRYLCWLSFLDVESCCLQIIMHIWIEGGWLSLSCNPGTYTTLGQLYTVIWVLMHFRTLTRQSSVFRCIISPIQFHLVSGHS